MLFPTEIWLLVIQFLSTRDLVFLSLTCHADDEIKKRLDINNVLSKYMADVDRFRSVMRTTESFIIGNFTIAFLTGNDLPNLSYIENFLTKKN
jgi:hypothetical protein